MKKKLPRRQFLKGAAVAGCASLLPACGKLPGRWRFFTEAEAAVVSAVCEQIIPADQDAGAISAGVPNFIDKQLTGPYKRHQGVYRTGLAGVQETSRAMFGSGFETLNWDNQTSVLRALESDKAEGQAWESQSSRAFFQLIRDHTMQGFYGSPRHGGNRDYVSYRMLGLDYPQVIGQNRYKKSQSRKA
ncbi:MAG TPA: gluconate 2-dehydrogenase subunit 3 family protein [Acidobacteriota bacterium]|nr:gluconate 2-dehydrogenase subunit 3 family protein [Acidobacteriota bacterium]